MAKEITYNVEASELLKEGVNALSNAVEFNQGPQARNRLTEQKSR